MVSAVTLVLRTTSTSNPATWSGRSAPTRQVLPSPEPLRRQKSHALAQGIVDRQFNIRFPCQAKG